MATPGRVETSELVSTPVHDSPHTPVLEASPPVFRDLDFSSGTFTARRSPPHEMASLSDLYMGEENQRDQFNAHIEHDDDDDDDDQNDNDDDDDDDDDDNADDNDYDNRINDDDDDE